LLRQSRRCDEIVVAPGPRSSQPDLELLKRIGVRVLKPVEGIGRARVRAILSTDADIVVSCDSDSIYYERYVEEAVNSLMSGFKAVKAGHVEPAEWSIGALLELPLATLLTYEFGLAFWRREFLKTRAPAVAESTISKLWDIGPIVALDMQPILINPRMSVKTRLPTHATKSFVNSWTTQIAGSVTPIVIAIGATSIAEILRANQIKK
jgi:hypothetical protein